MNAVWIIRWERLKWIMRLGPLHAWIERRRVRRELLAHPGVDHLVRSVMDMRYGKHCWRVKDDMLEAQVVTHGQGAPWWGPIGPLRNITTRKWLTGVWMEHKGHQVSHAKLPEPFPYVGPDDEAGFYQGNYADTEPQDDDGRISK